MNLTKYVLHSRRYNGKLLLAYRDGVIYSFINEMEKITEAQWDALMKEIPFDEVNISHLESIGLEVKHALKTNEKVALFCRLYEKHRGLKYKASNIQGRMMSDMDVNEELLTFYFTSDFFDWKGKWSIQNLRKYYNELRDRYFHRHDPKPIIYSRKQEQTLTGAALSEYWKQLREAGYEAVKVGGSIVDWVKKPANASPNPNITKP